MNIPEIHGILLEKFGEATVGTTFREAIDAWIEVAPEAIVEVSLFLRDDERLQFDHLNDLCGVDYFHQDPKKLEKAGFDPHLEVVYQLCSIHWKHRARLKVVLPRWKDDVPGQLPSVPSVTPVWDSANWHEREAYDLMGIHFEGHPNLRRILCPEDWEGHPLRKDYTFPLEYHGIRGR